MIKKDYTKNTKYELKRGLREVTDKLNNKIINIQKDILVLEKYYDSLEGIMNTYDSKDLTEDEAYELKSYLEIQRDEIEWMMEHLKEIKNRF